MAARFSGDCCVNAEPFYLLGSEARISMDGSSILPRLWKCRTLDNRAGLRDTVLAVLAPYASRFSHPVWGKVRQETFQGALDQFGAQGLTELTTLKSYYALLAFNSNAFEIDLPAERTEPVLPT